jgi:hypothetical protein
MVKLLAFALSVALTASLTACPERPNTNRRTDPRTVRTVVITAHSNMIPYEVIVDVYDETGAHEGTREYVASTIGEYRQTLDYTSGRRLRIRVEVKPPRKNSSTWCRIRDGRRTEYDTTGSRGEKGWRAICELATNR